MSPLFFILAIVTLGSAIAAISLRNLVHCALSLAVCFAGLAAIYLHLNAQFVGFAQVLVYIGAVAILIVFAILLTRSSENQGPAVTWSSWGVGAVTALIVFLVLASAILKSDLLGASSAAPPTAPVSRIGHELMTQYVLPLQVIGLLLTAALIGAVIIAMRDKEGNR